MSARLLRGAVLPLVIGLAVLAGSAVAARAAPGPQWWLARLDVGQAWQSTEGSGVTVAVLSTGVAAANPDLTGTVSTGPDYTNSGRVPGGPFWGNEGTAVASLIAGHGSITGIAPAAKILSLRVTLEYNDPLNSEPRITRHLPDAIAAGIRYAVGRGAKVIALPLDPGTLGVTPAGVLTTTGDPAAAGGSQAESAAVGYALSKNVVLIAPAGDNGQGTGTVNFPAAYPGVLAVGAVTTQARLAPFSSRLGYVKLTAPGAAMTVPAPASGNAKLSTTDAASAIVAGIAALVRAKYPRLTASQVNTALEQSTQSAAGPLPPAGAAGTGYGIVDAGRALDDAATLGNVTPHPSPSPTPRPATRGSARHADGGSAADQAIQFALIGLGVLIAVAFGAMLVSRGRGKRSRAERTAFVRAENARYGQRGRGAHSAHRSRHQASAADPWQGVRLTDSKQAGGTLGVGATALPAAYGAGSAGKPKVAPMRKSTSSRRRAAGKPSAPPWEPALRPPDVGSDPADMTTRPLLGTTKTPVPPFGPSPVPPQTPPSSTPPFAAAPTPADASRGPRKTSTDPLYIWNPAAVSPPITDTDEPRG